MDVLHQPASKKESIAVRATAGILTAGFAAVGIAGIVLYSNKHSLHTKSVNALAVNDIVAIGTTYSPTLDAVSDTVTYATVSRTVPPPVPQTAGTTSLIFDPTQSQSPSQATLFRVTKVSVPPQMSYLRDTVKAVSGFGLELYDDPTLGIGAKYTPDENWEVAIGDPDINQNNVYLYINNPSNAQNVTPVEFGFDPTGDGTLYVTSNGPGTQGNLAPAFINAVVPQWYLLFVEIRLGPQPVPFQLEIKGNAPGSTVTPGNTTANTGKESSNTVPPNASDPSKGSRYNANKVPDVLLIAGWTGFVLCLCAWGVWEATRAKERRRRRLRK